MRSYNNFYQLGENSKHRLVEIIPEHGNLLNIYCFIMLPVLNGPGF